MTIKKTDLLQAVAIASGGYFAGNPVAEERIEPIVRAFFRVLASGSGSELLAVDHHPAVPVADSVSETEITCIECGKRMRSLKIHLRKTHNLSPDEYRIKWGLKDTYPMMPPRAAQMRSGLSKATIENMRKSGRRVGRPRKPAVAE